jgi:hypothetical protein
VNSILAGLIFVLWPTSGVAQQPTIGGVSGLLWTALLTVDRPVNFLPSLHVANACICGFAMGREPNAWRYVAPIWALLIVVSTLTTKQHFVVDLPAGAALAGLSVWLVHKGVRVETGRSWPLETRIRLSAPGSASAPARSSRSPRPRRARRGSR